MAAETRLPDRGAAPRSSHLPRGQSPNKQLGPLRIWRSVLSLESGHQLAACVCLCFLSHLLSRSLFQERPKSGGRNAGQGVGMFGSWFCTAAMGKCRWRTKKGPSQSSAGATARGYLASCPFSAPCSFHEGKNDGCTNGCCAPHSLPFWDSVWPRRGAKWGSWSCRRPCTTSRPTCSPIEAGGAPFKQTKNTRFFKIPAR